MLKIKEFAEAGWSVRDIVTALGYSRHTVLNQGRGLFAAQKQQRNAQIRTAYADGMTAKRLAKIYKLDLSVIYKIVKER